MKNGNTKVDSFNKSEARLERVTLAEARNMIYEKFRTNIRVLRSKHGWSGVEAAEKIGLKHGKRMIDLEYGRANPDMDEMLLIAKYFDVKIDDLLNKEAKITFE